MLRLQCDQVRPRLSAFHDEELSFADRIAIADHLDACPVCRIEAADLMEISRAMRETARSEDIAWIPGLGRLQGDMLVRWEAEEKASLGQRIRGLFDDPQRASASLGLSIVISVLLAASAFMLGGKGPFWDPESVKAILTTPTEGARTGDIYLPRTWVELPRVDAEAAMPAALATRDAGDDEVAFAALVTAEGHLEDLEYLVQQGRPAKHRELSTLLNAAATARFAPARVAGSPVSFNVVWVVANTTVRPPLRASVRVRVDGWKML
jgi:hypothetical protein